MFQSLFTIQCRCITCSFAFFNVTRIQSKLIMKRSCFILLLAIVSLHSLAQAGSNPSVETSGSEKVINKQDTIAYATLYFYRSFVPKMVAPMKKVPIYINDTLVHTLKANTIASVKVLKEGRYRIATDEKGENLLPVRIKLGQEYFFKCDIEAGLWFGKPTIQPVTAKFGKANWACWKRNKRKPFASVLLYLGSTQLGLKCFNFLSIANKNALAQLAESRHKAILQSLRLYK